MIRKISELRKVLKENLEPSSLQVISFKEIRSRFDIDMKITDLEMIMTCKSLNFDFFGESGIWAKTRINRK